MSYTKISSLPLEVAPSGYMYVPIVDPNESSVANRNKRVLLSSLSAVPASVNYINTLYLGSTAAAPNIQSGTGNPDGVVSAAVGSIYLRTDGGPLTSIYFKETGAGNTGWVANAAVSSGVFYSPLTYVGSNSTSPSITAGSGIPEGTVTASVGSIYLRSDGGATTSIYYKEAGSSNTGWVSNSAISSGELYTYTVISGNKTLTNKERTTVISSGIIVTLPSGPSTGFEVGVMTASGITDAVVSGNGQRIMSLAENLSLDFENNGTTLVYVNSDLGWRVL